MSIQLSGGVPGPSGGRPELPGKTAGDSKDVPETPGKSVGEMSHTIHGYKFRAEKGAQGALEYLEKKMGKQEILSLHEGIKNARRGEYYFQGKTERDNYIGTLDRKTGEVVIRPRGSYKE